MKHHHIVIMAGGIGSRFWPMSTPTYPKQFIDVMGVGKLHIPADTRSAFPVISVHSSGGIRFSGQTAYGFRVDKAASILKNGKILLYL